MKKNSKLFVLIFLITISLFAQKEATNITEILKDFEEIALEGMQQEKLPGMAIGIVYGDEIVYLKGFGVKKEGSEDKVDPDTVFQLASVSKPLTGTVVAGVVSQGKLSWDDKLKLYVPNFKVNSDWVTDQFMIRDALSHRSGFRPFAGDDLDEIGYNLSEITDRLQYLTPVSSFRSQYAYQNIFITLGALAAANFAKKDFNSLAKEVLFDPLDMKSSGFFFSDYENAKNKAYSHVKNNDNNWAALYTRNADNEFGGAGASSTVRDMCNWLIMYLNKGQFKGKQVIDPKALWEAHTPQILSANTETMTSFYAMGIVISYDNIENSENWKHAGAFTTGIRSIIYMLPKEKLGLVVLVNAFPSGLPEGLAKALNVLYKTSEKAPELKIDYDGQKNNAEEGKLKILYNAGIDKESALSSYEDIRQRTFTGLQSLIEKDATKPKEDNLISLPLDRYVGTYKSFYYDLLEVKQTAEGIEAFIGKYHVKLDLKHFEGHVFSYTYRDTSKQEWPGFLTFELDSNGKVTGAKLSGFSEDVFRKNSNEVVK